MLPDQGDARGEEDQPRGCEDDSEPIPCERQPHATSTLSPRDDQCTRSKHLGIKTGEGACCRLAPARRS